MDLQSIERVEINPLGGPNTVIVGDLTGTGVRQVAIDLSATPGTDTGDGQADVVSVNGTAGADHITVTGSGHTIEVDADSARFTLAIENVPSENPKTGRIVALSVLATLRKLNAPLRVGT